MFPGGPELILGPREKGVDQLAGLLLRRLVLPCVGTAWSPDRDRNHHSGRGGQGVRVAESLTDLSRRSHGPDREILILDLGGVYRERNFARRVWSTSSHIFCNVKTLPRVERSSFSMSFRRTPKSRRAIQATTSNLGWSGDWPFRARSSAVHSTPLSVNRSVDLAQRVCRGSPHVCLYRLSE